MMPTFKHELYEKGRYCHNTCLKLEETALYFHDALERLNAIDDNDGIDEFTGKTTAEVIAEVNEFEEELQKYLRLIKQETDQ